MSAFHFVEITAGTPNLFIRESSLSAICESVAGCHKIIYTRKPDQAGKTWNGRFLVTALRTIKNPELQQQITLQIKNQWGDSLTGKLVELGSYTVEVHYE